MTKSLPIWHEAPPDDTVVVVRGGLMAADGVVATATDTFDDFGVYCVSVEAAMGLPVEDLCRRSRRLSRYGKVRLSTFGRLRAAAFAVIATFDPPHFDIVLPDVSELTVTRLDRCFEAPIPNPGRTR